MIKRNVDNAIDAHFQKVTEMLREIMDKSPDPHLPEERERAISDLIERAFPNLGIVLLKDEEEFTHIASVVSTWITEATIPCSRTIPRSGALDLDSLTSGPQPRAMANYDATPNLKKLTAVLRLVVDKVQDDPDPVSQRNQARILFWSNVKDDKDLVSEMLGYWFDDAYDGLVKPASKSRSVKKKSKKKK